MKLLKYACLFHGRQYPVLLVLFSLLAAGMLSAALMPPQWVLIALFAGLPLLVLIAAFLYEHHLTTKEKRLISQSAAPQWSPVTPEIIAAIRRTTPVFSRHAAALLLLIALLCPAAFIPRKDGTFRLPLLLLFAGIALITAICGFLLPKRLRSIGSEAEFAVIPVDHIDLLHRHTRNRRWVERYAVCYLPDGKYVLRINGTGQADRLTIVRCGMLHCVLTPNGAAESPESDQPGTHV